MSQGDTLDEVTANIRETIGVHLEGEDLAELRLAENSPKMDFKDLIEKSA